MTPTITSVTPRYGLPGKKISKSKLTSLSSVPGLLYRPQLLALTRVNTKKTMGKATNQFVES